MDPDKKKQIKAQKQAETRKVDDILTQAFRRTFKDQDSKVVLRWLMENCGFLESDIVVSHKTGEVNPMSTVHNMARRALYIKVRALLDPQFVHDVECFDPMIKELSK